MTIFVRYRFFFGGGGGGEGTCSYGGAVTIVQGGAMLHSLMDYITLDNEIRWHNVLMWNMLICILCMAFVVEMLEQHQENISISMQLEVTQQMCFQWCTTF